jgi:mono/diheme cytochrome c family protein
MKIASLVVVGAVLLGGARFQKTSRDKIYSKEQATRGEVLYTKRCVACHDPAVTLPPGKERGPELVGEAFITAWENRKLEELLTTTLLTMPNDASYQLSEQETADVIAHLLKANGYPEGPADLKYGAGKDILIVK